MKPVDQVLVRRLAVVLAIKLVLLFGLWWGFVRDQRVTVDASSMAKVDHGFKRKNLRCLPIQAS